MATSITISRFQLEPREEPTHYGVGFTVLCDNGRTFYRDIAVPLKDCVDKDGKAASDTYIAQIAYNMLEDELNALITDIGGKSILLGTQFSKDDVAQAEIKAKKSK